MNFPKYLFRNFFLFFIFLQEEKVYFPYMSFIGVIMGELLVSKEGLGYLIMYGSQVFNINLVITSVVLLGIVSYLMYLVVSFIEKKVIKHNA